MSYWAVIAPVLLSSESAGPRAGGALAPAAGISAVPQRRRSALSLR